MPPSERRASIVTAAIPILIEKGDSITVSEVAAAAGVAEGTVFKVFPTRESLIQSCMESVIDSRELATALAESRETGSDASLKEQLLSVAESLEPYLLRALPVLQSVGSRSERDSLFGPYPLLKTVDSLISREFDTRFGWNKSAISNTSFSKSFVAALFGASMQRLAGLNPPTTDQIIDLLVHGQTASVNQMENP